MASRSNKSDVWVHFEKLSSTKVRCKLCSKELAVAGGVTSSMHTHLHSKHASLSSAASHRDSEKPSIKQFVTARSCSDSRQEKISDALARVIADNMLPISLVDSQSVKYLFELLEPNYKLPCRQTMTNRLESMKGKLSKDIKDHLAANVSQISITTDIWTSLTNEAYLSFTASYINADWTMHTPVLATAHLEERHTQSVIAESLSKVARDWEIESKIFACVHDGAANCRDVGSRNKWTDLHCAAHKLQLCITGGLGLDKVSNHPIAKCVAAASRLVGHFSHSPMAVGELKKRQLSMNPDQRVKKLIQHCKTRWNSVYDMFERLVELRWPVCAVLSDRSIVKLSEAKTLELKDEHWQLMADLLPVLKPLQVATSVLSAEAGPSASTVYPMLWGLLKNHLDEKDDDSSVVSAFKKTVSDAVSERFGMTDMATSTNICVTASVLDPNFKHLPG